jgi:hypothetical protein
MTDEEINAAIHKACGWEYKPKNCGGADCCNDLNAMHEAEQEQWRKNHNYRYYFLCELINIVMPSTGYRAEAADLLDAILDATARQRAEAFLKTIGKWKEAE